MAGSIVVDTKKQIVADLDALASFDGVQVSYAFKGEVARKEHLYFTSVGNADSEIETMRSGRKRREETSILRFTIEVQSKATPELNETRALVLLTVVDEYLADSPNLSGAVSNLKWCVLDTWDMRTTEVAGEQSMTRIEGELSCRGSLV